MITAPTRLGNAYNLLRTGQEARGHSREVTLKNSEFIHSFLMHILSKNMSFGTKNGNHPLRQFPFPL